MSQHDAHPHRHHHWRAAAVAFLASGLTLLAIMLLVSSDAIGTPPDPNYGHKVTLCHAEGNGSWHEITVDVAASGLGGGHDSGNGVHASDIIPPFTWIDNKDVQQVYGGLNLGTSFDGVLGSTILGNGCVAPTPPPPPTDVCPNIDGNQATVPDGMIKNADGNCVKQPDPVDACPNIDGLQDSVPVGYVVNAAGECVEAGTETDACPNIEGNQATVPEGYYVDGRGDCVKPQVPGGGDGPDPEVEDVCSNIAGDQATVPAGLVLQGGACVVPAADTTPDDGDATPTPTPTPTPTDTDAPTAGEVDGPTTPTEFETRTTGNVVDTDEELPFTGAEQNLIIALGFGFILIGTMLEFTHRRKRAA